MHGSLRRTRILLMHRTKLGGLRPVRAGRRGTDWAAWEAIARSGLPEVTMRDIARSAGFTTGAVTHYFTSKDEILVAALEQVADATLERLRSGHLETVEDLVDLLVTVMPTTPALRDEWRVWLGFWDSARGVSRTTPCNTDRSL